MTRREFGLGGYLLSTYGRYMEFSVAHMQGTVTCHICDRGAKDAPIATVRCGAAEWLRLAGVLVGCVHDHHPRGRAGHPQCVSECEV